jgi:restriction system protein
MVHAGEHGRLFDDFKNNKIVAIGWHELGDLSNVRDADQIREMVDQKYAGQSTGWKAMAASQVSRFRFDFKEDDYVLTYDPEKRVYIVGVIKGPYHYDSTRKEYCNTRKVVGGRIFICSS